MLKRHISCRKKLHSSPSTWTSAKTTSCKQAGMHISMIHASEPTIGCGTVVQNLSFHGKNNATRQPDGEGSLPKQELNMNQVRMTQIVFVILQRDNLR